MTADKLILQAVLFLSLLSAASALDIRQRIIPNSICIGIAVTGLILFSPIKLLGILAALPLVFAALFIGGMGGGDIKLVAATGVVLGLEGVMVGTVIGLSAMVLFHVQQKAFRRPWDNDKRAAYPLAPFLSLGFLFIYFLKFGGKCL